MESTPSAHDQVLTEKAQAEFRPGPSVPQRVEAFRRARGLAPEQIRVLDWGCGRGRTVFWLRDRGYDACGIDIDPKPVENGRPLARERGLDAERVLTVLDDEGRAPYPDESFDFTCSYQVFEHVENMDRAASELARITAPGGGGAHIYRASCTLVEGHLMMPFVHWLPKNRLRFWLIRLWVALGIQANLDSYRVLAPAERASKFYRYSVERTFYRNCGAVRRVFERAGLEARLGAIDSDSVRRRIGALADVPVLRSVLNLLLTQFVTVHLTYRKPWR